MKVNSLTILITLMTFVSAKTAFVIYTKKVSSPIKIDGLLDDQWQEAFIADNFIQFEPNLGHKTHNKTEVMVLYDSQFIYIAFRLWDFEPPTAQLTRRDAKLLDDDAVILILDTYYDRRSAYYFMTNALSTQTDGRIVDDGRTVDNTWDAYWQCASQRTDTSWTVEMGIPFTSLKYTTGDSVQWGINFGRTRRRNLETSFWAGPLDNIYRVSQAGRLMGLQITPLPRRYQIIPYALSRFQEKKTSYIDAGIDLRYAFTPRLSAYFTVNPDFATIEADQEQINLTRFELELSEKRQFFLEGNELFQQRIRTFYSRRISDITVGAKILGKEKSWTLATLGTRSEPVGDSALTTYAVARAQKDILGTSNVALTVANRTLKGKNVGSTGLDATLFFTKTVGMTTQLVQSYGFYNYGTWAYFIRPAYDSPTTHFHLRYTYLGTRVADNVNVIGYIKDDDRRELDSALEKILWFKTGLIERLAYDSNYNIYWGQNSILRSWQIDQSIEVDWRNRFSTEIEYTAEFKRFEEDFRNRKIGLELGYNTREFQSISATYNFGKNLNSDFQLWTVEAGYKLTNQLSLEYELEYLTLEPDPEGESTWIHVLKTNQFFTKDLYLRIFFQINSVIDRKNLQAVLVYRYQPPFGTIQLAYQVGTAAFGQRSEQGNTLFIKLTHVW